ncbi:protein of unknown function [Xenorhabdus doucetiae]|uniref:Uncharacterized protein n=1 Tax=Xenorhabdus doucetiae TaxID=351671 RepID=A0A068QXK5_9GAMM|nr:hypothetical protein LY16_02602 [Xenorhabdus doucetiae]CDG18585.1 protein of unknown function [Xenorhabdus doucetiae]
MQSVFPKKKLRVGNGAGMGKSSWENVVRRYNNLATLNEG